MNTVTRWYVARGCLPMRVQGQTDGQSFYVAGFELSMLRIFETEREALKFALKSRKRKKLFGAISSGKARTPTA